MNRDFALETAGVPAEIISPVKRLAMNRIGIWLFFLSESFLFSALLITRYYLQGVTRPPQVNQPLGFGISLILLLSSLTAYRGEMHIANGMTAAFRRNVISSIVLGTLFLVGVGFEWSEAFRYFPPKTGFGTLFFTLTGFHAFHVLLGVLGLVTLVLPGQAKRFSPENYWGAEGIIKFWHFVDVVWMFIFPTLYLVN